MKTKFLLFFIFFNLSNIYSQNEVTGGIEEYVEVNPYPNIKGISIVDSWAMYPNGSEGIINHIKRIFIYPEDAIRDSIVGEVIVEYIIQKDGSVGEIRILQGVHPSLDKEAIRIIEVMDRWKPAIQRGKPVKLKYKVPISFKIR